MQARRAHTFRREYSLCTRKIFMENFSLLSSRELIVEQIHHLLEKIGIGKIHAPFYLLIKAR